jgi:hypothetical protein
VKRKGDYSFLWFVATATLVLIATILFTILVAAFEFQDGSGYPGPIHTDPRRLGVDPPHNDGDAGVISLLQ